MAIGAALQLLGVPTEHVGFIPSPSSGYTTGAVSFDGLTSLVNAALVSTENEFFSAVWWQNLSALTPASSVVWVTDPDGQYWNVSGFGDFSPDYTFAAAVAGLNSGTGHSEQLAVQVDTTDAPPSNVWSCVMMSCDGNALVGKVFVGDVDVSGPILNPPGDTFVVKSNGLPFWVGDDDTGGPDNIIGALADFRIMPGISLLTGGTIAQATRRLFIDGSGKPVDPAVATAALGAPAVLLRRAPAAAATTFATNLGTGGNFTITGTLTNAPTSPST